HIQVFENKMEEYKNEEIVNCNLMAYGSDYLSGCGPYGQSTEGFKRLLESGERVKFAIHEKGIFIGRANISHACIASFQQVISSGHVMCQKVVAESVEVVAESADSGKKPEDYELRLLLDNETGHYRMPVSSLVVAISRFESIGYAVDLLKDWVTGLPVDFSSECV
ncbi:hypothetical protein, partial [Candidatus Ichthyocystis sparus]